MSSSISASAWDELLSSLGLLSGGVALSDAPFNSEPYWRVGDDVGMDGCTVEIKLTQIRSSDKARCNIHGLKSGQAHSRTLTVSHSQSHARCHTLAVSHSLLQWRILVERVIHSLHISGYSGHDFFVCSQLFCLRQQI